MAQTFLNLAQGVTGTLPNANFSGGKIGQVLQDSYSNEVNVSSSTYSSLNLSRDITPSATSSKILIMASLEGVGRHSGCDSGKVRLEKDGSELVQFTNVSGGLIDTSVNFYGSSETCFYIDSPNTTSSITYSVTARRNNSTGGWRINTNGASYSTITVMEILA